MRAAALFVLLAFAPPAGAQEDVAPDGPVLRVEFDETEAIPGQPLSLRMTVLVPTFLPEPPVWPSLEAPNLLVRLPERSTNPTSARVGGETWAGVTRNYRISPMVPGEFAIPPQEVVVTWADPESNAPARAILRSEALAFRGVVPAGAEGLDPFVAATSLELAQTIEGEPGAMTPGDSVTRTVVATVAGTAPMFLPELMPPVAIEGVAAYPDEPLIAETDDRGTLGGSRTERVTLVAEGGGSGAVPAVTLDWYDLETGRVETASVETLFSAPSHPYTRGLIACMPTPEHRAHRLTTIPGQAPQPGSITAGCAFAPRCPDVRDICRADPLTRATVADGHEALCKFPVVGGPP